jgi:hypothetical protein
VPASPFPARGGDVSAARCFATGDCDFGPRLAQVPFIIAQHGRVALYNDACAPTIGDKHPKSAGSTSVGRSVTATAHVLIGAIAVPS